METERPGHGSPPPPFPAAAGGAPERGENPFTHEEITRFARHLVLPEIGPSGQARLRRARVFVAGAGGLGSPVLLYLAAAGVGRIAVADPDPVDLTNLQRQILHAAADAGRPKTDSAAERIAALDRSIETICVSGPILPQNALDLLKGYDLVVDGTDNLASRYLLADACALLGIPMLHGSVDRFAGQAALFPAGGRPCYRCLYPEPPPPGFPPAASMAGVFGPLPGVIGTFLASEAVKLLAGAGEPLAGRLLLTDLLRPRFRILEIPRDPNCPLCGDRPSIRALEPFLYEVAGCFPGEEENASCRERADRRALAVLLSAAGLPLPAEGEPLPDYGRITPGELRARLDRGDPPVLLDLRRPLEREIARIEDSLPLPIEELPERSGELNREAEIVCVCRMGIRSARAAMFLRALGFRRAINLEGGILAWIDEVDPSLPRY